MHGQAVVLLVANTHNKKLSGLFQDKQEKEQDLKVLTCFAN